MKYSQSLLVAVFLLLTSFTLQAKVYSVIIGVADYQGNEALSYAEQDAYLFSLTLMSDAVQGFDVDNSYLLINEDASPAVIAIAVDYVFAQAGPDDAVIFYYTGHGMHAGLYAYGGGEQGVYPYAHLRNAIRKSRAGSVLLFLDACKSGSFFLSTQADMDALVNHFSEEGDGKSRRRDQSLAIFTSSRAGETSYESSRLGHGVFTYFLCKALSGKADKNNDRLITMSELYTYLRNGTYTFTKQQIGRPQCPLLFGDFPLQGVIAANSH
jgi:uncharacterized caspase-like protein